MIMTEEEQNFWDEVSVFAALGDVLGFDVVDAMQKARIPLPNIIKLAAEQCFLYPEQLGPRRHTRRIRKLLHAVNNGEEIH